MKWGGAILTVLLVVVWIGSGWLDVIWDPGGGGEIGVEAGQLWIAPPYLSGVLDHSGIFTVFARVGPLNWWFTWENWGDGPAIAIPLWFPALLSLLATAAAWRADAKYLRRVREGACPACGYDRAGLAAGAVCPECGATAGV